MADKASLILEDGAVFEGKAFGAVTDAIGEVVFNTSMTGYQEILTDPSYAGQIVVPTYPLIGNYGINEDDSESRRVQVKGFVVREHCDLPSHWQSRGTLHEFLESQGIPGVSGVDTRAITRRLRSRGVMMGAIATEEMADEALERLKRGPAYGDLDYVSKVTTRQAYSWNDETPAHDSKLGIVVVDLGLKYNILRILESKGCRVKAIPSWATAEAVLANDPDGVLLSPGPGDPAMLDYAVDMARALIGVVPVMGICLGHQVLGRALGASTYKLKFGHRGGNHPVRDLDTGRVHITAQNHGYSVDADSMPSNTVVTHINLNDETVEGFRHTEAPVLAIQYHSEGSPGPQDNVALFDRFLDMVRGWKGEA